MKKEIFCVSISFILAVVISFFLKDFFVIQNISSNIIILILFLTLFLVLTFILKLIFINNSSKSTINIIKEVVPKVNNNISVSKDSGSKEETKDSKDIDVSNEDLVNDKKLINKDNEQDKYDSRDNVNETKKNIITKEQKSLDYFGVSQSLGNKEESNSIKDSELVKENISEPMVTDQDKLYKDIPDSTETKQTEVLDDKKDLNIKDKHAVLDKENIKKEKSFVKLSKFEEVNSEDKS